jgi:hypothetical protein
MIEVDVECVELLGQFIYHLDCGTDYLRADSITGDGGDPV